VISKLKKMEAEEEEEHLHENIGNNVKIEGLNQSDSGHSDSDRED
jgi:hypothetical protein